MLFIKQQEEATFVEMLDRYAPQTGGRRRINLMILCALGTRDIGYWTSMYTRGCNRGKFAAELFHTRRINCIVILYISHFTSVNRGDVLNEVAHTLKT